MLFRRRGPNNLPRSSPVWRARYDCSLPSPNPRKAQVIRRDQLVLDPVLLSYFPSDYFEIAGYRTNGRIRLTDDGPEWLFRAR